jgi:hypothetical protein
MLGLENYIYNIPQNFLVNYHIGNLYQLRDGIIFLIRNITDYNFSSFLKKYQELNISFFYQTDKIDKTYGTTLNNLNTFANDFLYQGQEKTSDYRNQRTQSPIFRYDFKLGNYMPEEFKRKSPHLFLSIHDLTTGLRKPF